MDLLRQYAHSQSESAFAELVGRHINLVFSVALRHVANAQDAEDVTQAVFILLARKAAALGPGTAVTGWLYKTTRFTAARAVRARARRHAREQEGSMQSGLSEADHDSVWRQLAPLLDEAMARLTEKERAVLGLRYFENRSAAETAALLGIGQWAAHKRSERAVEKLRAFFARRGVGVSAASLTGAVSAHSVQAAPAMLAKSVTVVALVKGTGAGGSTLALVKGALRVMAWTKAKTAAVGLGAVLIAGMGTVVVSNTFLNPREPSYHGRVLSEWLADLESSLKTRAEAQEAIRQMGKKTLPFLVMDLAWPGGTAGTTKIHYSKPDTRSGDRRLVQARMAFEALGPLGKPAVPKLVKLLEQNPGYVPHALGGIGREALPQLLNALTNGSFWVRDNTAAALANALYAGRIQGEEAKVALPVALKNLTYNDTNSLFLANTRYRAADLVAALKLDPDTSVPALIQGLEDTNPSVRMNCAYGLGHFRGDAREAIPSLRKAAASSDAQLRRAANFSIDAIEQSR